MRSILLFQGGYSGWTPSSRTAVLLGRIDRGSIPQVVEGRSFALKQGDSWGRMQD